MSDLDSKTPLTPPKEGLDARVGQEFAHPGGWLLARTKRVERLLAQPEVMELANRLAEHTEKFCTIRNLELNSLEPDIEPTRSRSYITIRLGS